MSTSWRIVLALICTAATGHFAAAHHSDLWYGHGTAAVVMRSPKLLAAGIDSKETYLRYAEGGVRTDDREICKAARLGSDYALVAGLDRGSNGYDALSEAASVWQSGDDLNALASKIEGVVAQPLTSLLSHIRAVDPSGFDQRFRGQTVTEMGLFGVEDRVPRLVILEFTESESATEHLYLSLRETRCPGDCSHSSTAYFLGVHDEIDSAVRRNPKLLSPPSESNVETLIHLEMLHRPDIVGGPVAMIAMNQSGNEFVNPGACSSGELMGR